MKFVRNTNKDTKPPCTYLDVDIQNGIYYKLTKDIDTQELIHIPLGNAVLLSRKLVNLDDYSHYFDFHFKDANNNTYEGVIFPREKLNSKGILELAKFGVMVDEKKAPFLLHTIFNQEVLFKGAIDHIHTKLGFKQIEEQQIFLGHKGFGTNSVYNGDMAIKPKGDYKTWRAMIKEDVEGHTPLETILAIAVAGMFKDYLGDKIDVTNPFVHLIGDSSCGKTTAGMLAVSLGASPNIADKSFVYTCDSTQNSIMQLLTNSYPVLLDEGSQLNGNKTNFIYAVSNGKDKGRLTKEIELREVNTFNTSIFLTSENSIVDECDVNTGIRIRVLEFTNVVWTKSAESSDRIKAVIKNNYGFALYRIAKYLLKESVENNVAWFKENVEVVQSNIKNRGEYNQFSNRLSNMYALIICSAEILNATLKLNFDSDKILNFLLDNNLLRSEEMADIGLRAYTYLTEYVSTHTNAFPSVDDSDSSFLSTNTTLKGKIQNGKIYIVETAFKEILRAGGFSDFKVVANKLRAKNLLHTPDKDRRPKTRFTLPNSTGRVSGYILKAPTE